MTHRFPSTPTRDGLRFLAVADLSAADFFVAQNFAGFSGWTDFEDFQYERDGLSLAYEAAGARAPRQPVPFESFLGWSRLTGAPLDLDGLDEFAAHWLYRAQRPAAPAQGVWGTPGRPEHNAVEIDGVQSLVIDKSVYRRWRDDFSARAPFPAPDRDAYARQVVVCCLSPFARARRSALKFV